MGVSLRRFCKQFGNLSCSVKSVFQAFYNTANVFDCKIQCMRVAVYEQASFIDIFNLCRDTRAHQDSAGSIVTLFTATQKAETVTQNNFLK